MSVGFPVELVEPWVKSVAIPATLTPSPTWAGLVLPTSALLPPAECSICERVSSNWVELALKPVVLTLAMLLAVTSSIVWWARRPEMPESSERSMV